MVRSMTGFGRASTAMPGGEEAIVEVSAVNHRHQEFSLRLPQQWLCAEQPMRALLRQRVHRGKLSVTVRATGKGSAISARLNESVALSYLNAIRKLESLADLPVEPLSFRDLALLPGVLTHDEEDMDEEAVSTALVNTLSRALDMLDAARAAEGESLARDMRQRRDALLRAAEKILDRAPELQAAYMGRLRQRLEELVIEPGIREERLAMEAALMADRQDITEEAVRLKTHLIRFGELMESDGPIGRELGFLVQEIHREINTMGAKLRDIDCINETLWMKSEVEKIREQLQNIE
ncbi:MAG TPA: YicC family protein [Candidatus Hydrogenedentes bacterium]|nr:YicC family protein [Candidatus Hydrogenedentota bacterium]